MPHTRLVMFVSPNAAHWFAALRPEGCIWPAHTLAAAPGPGTADVVSTLMGPLGLPKDGLLCPPPDAAQFDSEHLWPVLAPRPWAGQQVLLISGGDDAQAQGRPWLSQQLRQAGAEVQTVLTYQRQLPIWQAPERQRQTQAWRQPREHLWLLSSSQAVDHLLTLAGAPPVGALALATHPRVAQRAREAGFEVLDTIAPQLEAVVQARRQAATP